MKIAVAILAGLVWGCDRSPQQVSPAAAQTGPVLPARHQSSEVIAPGGNYEPDGFPTISQLGEGQSGWIRPWTMWHTVGGGYFVNTGHSYRNTKERPDWIKITRKGNGFLVDLDKTSFEWSAIDMTYPIQGDGSNVPVLEFRE